MSIVVECEQTDEIDVRRPVRRSVEKHTRPAVCLGQTVVRARISRWHPRKEVPEPLRLDSVKTWWWFLAKPKSVGSGRPARFTPYAQPYQQRILRAPPGLIPINVCLGVRRIEKSKIRVGRRCQDFNRRCRIGALRWMQMGVGGRGRGPATDPDSDSGEPMANSGGQRVGRDHHEPQYEHGVPRSARISWAVVLRPRLILF